MPRPYPTALYHAVHTGNPGDVEFYRRVCQGAGTVLEAGCGTGRIGGALAADGLRVTGIDIDDAALETARGRGLEAIHADMCELDLGRTFERVIIPYNALYYLLCDADVVACLRRLAAHLDADGVLAFDGYGMDGWHIGDDAPVPEPAVPEPLGEIEVEGLRYAVSETASWWPEDRVVEARYRYQPVTGGEAIEATIPHRYLLGTTVGSLLEEAGLEMLSLEGDFEGARFGPYSPHLVVRAAHAGPSA